MSIKFQITLPEDLAAELKAAAAGQRISLAQFIRETMEARLRERGNKSSGHPFAEIAGLIESGEPDLAARVDEILYR